MLTPKKLTKNELAIATLLWEHAPISPAHKATVDRPPIYDHMARALSENRGKVIDLLNKDYGDGH